VGGFPQLVAVPSPVLSIFLSDPKHSVLLLHTLAIITDPFLRYFVHQDVATRCTSFAFERQRQL